ncbi:MAG: Glutamate-1-semialdehyde 2,1-aminomutase, partial [uncultured Nocardioides sp.]
DPDTRSGLGRPVRPCAGGDPGRGQLAGARVQRRRRHPALHALGERGVADRRRRATVRRPDLLLGAHAPRARAPRGAGRRQRSRGPRHVLRHPHRAGGGARRGDRRAHPRGGRAVRLLRHRGHDVGDPAGARIHRARRDRQVRRLLPRPRRLAPGLGRVGRRDPPGVRGAREPRRTRLLHRADDRAALQRPGGAQDGVRRARPAHRGARHRGGARQHGHRAARAGLQRAARAHLPRGGCAVRLRRGDDRLPGQPPRRLGPRRPRGGLGPRPDDLRQGDGRRLPGGGLRRPSRRDVAALPGGARLPGRHAVGEPDRHHRGSRHAAARDRRRLLPHRRRGHHDQAGRRRRPERRGGAPRRAGG